MLGQFIRVEPPPGLRDKPRQSARQAVVGLRNVIGVQSGEQIRQRTPRTKQFALGKKFNGIDDSVANLRLLTDKLRLGL